MGEFSKNEKDTQRVPNSDKNRSKFTKIITNNPIILAERFHTSLTSRYNYLSDPTLVKENELLIREFKILKSVISENPRLPWQIIQRHIYSLYQKDPSLIGVRIELIFNDLKKNNLKYFNPVIYGIPKE